MEVERREDARPPPGRIMMFPPRPACVPPPAVPMAAIAVAALAVATAIAATSLAALAVTAAAAELPEEIAERGRDIIKAGDLVSGRLAIHHDRHDRWAYMLDKIGEAERHALLEQTRRCGRRTLLGDRSDHSQAPFRQLRKI